MRTYRRKRPRQWRDKDKRMTLAVRLRGEGKSLRQIAQELGVNHETVRNDLARWARTQEATPDNVVTLSRKASKTGVESYPSGGEIRQPISTPRTTAEVMGVPDAAPRTVKEEQMARAIDLLSRSGA